MLSRKRRHSTFRFHHFLTTIALQALSVLPIPQPTCGAEAPSDPRYYFDGMISRPVLENYLARSINMLGLSDENDAMQTPCAPYPWPGSRRAVRAESKSCRGPDAAV